MSTIQASPSKQRTWGSDFFGTLNTLPPEPVALVAQVLEAMRTEPAFQRARRTMLAGLRLTPGMHVLDAGAGTGAALPDLVEIAGSGIRLTGVDPTDTFVALARKRAAELGCDARYESGDVRALPYPDAAFDAAFCDKLLLHAGPADAALAELVRVTRPGGRIGAVEWCPFFLLSTSEPELAASLNDALRQAVYDFMVSANLARHFQAVGIQDVETHVELAQARHLGDHPFWRAFLIDQLPLFVHAGLLPETVAEALARDLEELDRRGVFFASVVVTAVVGRTPTVEG
jgi:ubiquinone/menaquinone biosynthesis C-methylase UbiE